MLLVLDPDPAVHDRVAQLLTDAGLRATPLRAERRTELAQLVEAGTIPTAVVIGPGVELPTATGVATWLGAVAPGTITLLLATPTTTTLRAALRAGVRDVVSPTCSGAELGEALRAAGYDERHIEAGRDGLTVAVFSAKGGVGTSVLASNLAVRLAGRTGVPTILADLDLPSADQSVLHGLRPGWTVQEIADGVVGDDVDAVAQVLLPVPDTEVRVLAGPSDPAAAETIGDDVVITLLHRLRQLAAVVVVDTSSAFSDATLAVLERADVVVVVTSLDVLALRALSVALQTFDRLGIERDRLRIAVMRAGAKVGLTIDDVVRVTGVDVDVAVPSSRQVATSVNTGTPLAVTAPRSPVVRAVDDLVGAVVEGVVIDGFDGELTQRRRLRTRPVRRQRGGTTAAGSNDETDEEVLDLAGAADASADGDGVDAPAPARRRVVRVARPDPPPPPMADETDEVADPEAVDTVDVVEAAPEAPLVPDTLDAMPPPRLDPTPVGANGSTRRARRRGTRS